MLEEWIRGHRGGEEKSANKSKKSKYLLVILICLGLLALLWPVTKTEKPTPQVTGVEKALTNSDNSKTQLALELESILAQIEGAGEVDVSLTLSSDGKKTYASNIRNEKRDIEENDSRGLKKKSVEQNLVHDLAVSSGNPLIIEQEYPQVIGVLVVADGGSQPDVCEKLTDATATLLNISPHKVSVMPRKGDG